MAKSVPSGEAVLAGLRKAVESLPATRPLTGPGGIFPGGVKGKQLAQIATDEGLLITKEETAGSGAKPRKVTHGVLTEKGIKQVIDADSPKAVLEALLPAVRALGEPPAPPSPDAFRAELASATEVCAAAIREALARLEVSVIKFLAPPPRPAGTEAVLHALQASLERVQAPSVTVTTSSPSAAGPPTPSAELEDALVQFVTAWAREKTVGCQFDVLFDNLRGRFPHLTVGTFHDALRRLHDTRRVRLGGWPRMLDDLPRPNLALLVSSKVMYYAQPAHPNG